MYLVLVLFKNDEGSIRSKVIEALASISIIIATVVKGMIIIRVNILMDVLNISFDARVAT